MSKIKNGGLDQYGDGPSNSSNVEQLALKGLKCDRSFYLPSVNSLTSLFQGRGLVSKPMPGTATAG